jgi:dTDP-glucose pyrophosphorylase
MKDWESTLISPIKTLEEAIKILDKSALQIIMIIDEQRRLLGTITDGDIRRALLRHLPLTTFAHEIMCVTPQTARLDWDKDRILALMQSQQLLHVPIVDSENRVVNLATLHGLLTKHHLDNIVFLMAGGFGKRLSPLTNDCPKPMLKIGEKPILELIIEGFIDKGFHKFFVSTHYLPETIQNYFGDGSRWGVNIRYVHEEQPLGTGGALGLLPIDEIDKPIFMMNGDLLTNLNYLNLREFHSAQGGLGTVCVREHEYRLPYGVVQGNGYRVTNFIEKPTQLFYINAGIYFLSPEFIRLVKPGASVDMPALLDCAIHDGHTINMFPIHEYWLDIGRFEDFQRAKTEMQSFFGQ